MIMTRVRPPREDDRDEWLRMRRSLWPDCPDEEHDAEIGAFLRVVSEPWPSSGPYPGGNAAIFLAERADGRPCGFLEASIRPYAEGAEARPIGYIEGWFVDPDMRRSGVGRALVEAAEDWARAQGCRQMASDAEIDNAVSVEAHAALGYREVGRHVHFAKDLG
jgi:aminoglycoside 6'-N-acetyltransferase I